MQQKNHINTLVLATHNAGKVLEFKALLGDSVTQIITSAELGLPEPIETGVTCLENALLKARAASVHCQYPVLSDDSGLCVTALNGAPGVYSADWAGTPRNFDTAMQRVLTEMGNTPDKSAYFISVLVLRYPNGQEIIAEGRVDGVLIWPPRGQNGFGYDPMFIPRESNLTFGEMPNSDKEKYSHRARAVSALLKQIS